MFDCVVTVLREWQTLVAGVIALLAAWWTVREIGRQIKLQERQLSTDERRYAEARQRKSLAARVLMPDALSRLGGYAADCIKYILRETEELPNAPESAIGPIKSAVEYIESDAAEKLIELVMFYQVHNSRLSHFQRAEGPMMAERLYDSVRLRWLIDRMYSYARNEAEPPGRGGPRDEMISALRACVGIDAYFDNEGRWAPVVDLIELRHPQQ